METQHLKLKGRSSVDAETIRQAAEVLSAGGIVGFRTETVYGLGVNADRLEAVERLYQVKGRPRSKPFTVHIADVEQVDEVVGPVSAVGRRLMKRFWPGPLTIIFSRTDGSTVGVRLPDDEVARALIRQADCPVLAPSANLSGKAPAITADEVLRDFDGKIEAVLDSGRARFGRSSTVVRLVGEDYKIVREGVVSAERLRLAMNVSILLVCSGNSCRSAIAEALCRKILASKLGVGEEAVIEHGYTVASCGTRTTVGRPASVEMRHVAEELGLDLSEHLSRPVTEDLLCSADLIYVMTADQMEVVLKLCPEASGSVALLDPKGRPMADPHGGDMETYRRCAFLIHEALRKRLAKL